MRLPTFYEQNLIPNWGKYSPLLLVCLPRLSATLSVSEPRKLWRVKNIFTLRSQSHRLYDSVECNGVGEDHAQYSATRNGMKRRAADGKLLSARVIHENRIRPH